MIYESTSCLGDIIVRVHDDLPDGEGGTVHVRDVVGAAHDLEALRLLPLHAVRGSHCRGHSQYQRYFTCQVSKFK